MLAGYDNGDVKLFDLRMGTIRYETNVKNGVRWRPCTALAHCACACVCRLLGAQQTALRPRMALR